MMIKSIVNYIVIVIFLLWMSSSSFSQKAE